VVEVIAEAVAVVAAHQEEDVVPPAVDAVVVRRVERKPLLYVLFLTGVTASMLTLLS
jgi:hypothetical protein